MEDFMTDVLKATRWGSAMLPVSVGLASVSDNHGNSNIGFELTCAGKKPVRLGIMQWEALGESLGALRVANALSFDGELKMLPWQESPLQRRCRDLEAQAHQAPAQPQQHRR
jgi:hypothetical protein